MITEIYKKTIVHGQRLLAKTELFGREYYWLVDIDNTHYLTRIDENGNPDFSSV